MNNALAMPTGVRHAVIGTWATIAIPALVVLIDKLIGNIDGGEFTLTLFLYALFCIIPYKLSQGSNATRYVFLVLFFLSVLVMFGLGSEGLTQGQWITSIVLIPVEIFIIYRLFEAKAGEWFTDK